MVVTSFDVHRTCWLMGIETRISSVDFESSDCSMTVKSSRSEEMDFVCLSLMGTIRVCAGAMRVSLSKTSSISWEVSE